MAVLAWAAACLQVRLKTKLADIMRLQFRAGAAGYNCDCEHPCILQVETCESGCLGGSSQQKACLSLARRLYSNGLSHLSRMSRT